MAGRSIVAQLSPGDMLGNYKEVVRAAVDGTEIILGTVLGEVRGLSYRHNPQDDSKPSIALVGPFKFVPADENRPEIWSMRAFMPGAIHDSMVTSLEPGGPDARPYKKSPGRKEPAIDVALGAVLPVVLEVGVRKTSTAIGYEYLARTSERVPMELNDPLAALSERAGIRLGTGSASLPAPGRPAQKAIAAPKKKAKAK